MELDVIKQQTTWNDAANSINVNFSKIKQALALLEGADAGLNEEELIKFLEENGYATDAYVVAQISSIVGGADSDYDTLLKIQLILQGNEIDLKNLKEKVDNIETDNGMFSWLDEEERTTIFTEKNLVVEGDISDGGVGEAVVGVTIIRINDDDYYDESGDGIIDISAAFGNVDVDLSDYYTKIEVDELIAGIQPDEDNNGMFSWYDEDTIVTEHNLVVNGDVSDGGTGEAVVGVTGILIGEDVYYGEDGIVNLSAALGNIDVDLSNYYTIAEIDGLLTAYQPSETAINVDNIGAQSVAYADLSDKANGAYSLVNKSGEEFIYLYDSDIYHVGNIFPESSNVYFIGADEYFYKCVSANRFFAGSANNNLWLLAGSNNDKKIIFGSADSCATEVDDRTRFAELGDEGLQLNVDLILGDTIISEADNIVSIGGSLIVDGDVASTAEAEGGGGSIIVPDLSEYATIDWVNSTFYTIDDVDTMFENFADNYYNDGEIDSMLAGYLPIDGGEVDTLLVKSLTTYDFHAQAIYDLDMISAVEGGYIDVDGDMSVWGSLYVSGGGIYFDDDGNNKIEVDEFGNLLFFVNGNNVVWVNPDGIGTTGEVAAFMGSFDELYAPIIDDIIARLDALEGK